MASLHPDEKRFVKILFFGTRISFDRMERTLHDVTDEVIKSLVLEALRRCEGNKRCAARKLGIARDSLYRYMTRFGIESENRTADQDD
jgi:DNA-binding NtrC family response regulator